MARKSATKASSNAAIKKSGTIIHYQNPLFRQLEGTLYSCTYVYTGKLPMVVDYELLTEATLPADWHGKPAASRAAKGQETIAMYAGYFDCQVNITGREMADLTRAVMVEVTGDEEGEFSVPDGQVRLSKLISLPRKYFPVAQQYEVLNSMYTLQNPTSSPWGKPFIRVVSGHRFNDQNNVAHIRFVVYYNRLLFEMISDNEVKRLTDHLIRDKLRVIPARKKVEHKAMFTSDEVSNHVEYRFSLAGLMKRAENKGYPLASTQPEALNVPLYDFQKSTYQWMLDQELDEAGINYYFWEEWQYPAGNSLFYFPLAGEFRIKRPPKTNGGLLCEEMGLGKTIEIISLILGNPMKNIVTVDADGEALTMSKATLIVVPPTLLGQWLDEFHHRVTDIDTERSSFSVVRTDALTLRGNFTTKVEFLRRPAVLREGGVNTAASPWGFEYDGVTRLILRKGDVVDYQLPHALGCQAFSVTMKSDYAFNEFFGELRKCIVSFTDLEASLSEVDVVLTSYDSLRRDSVMYRHMHWHRIVLDECQEIKQSTTMIAKSCSDLQSSYRWMVSGTPLCTKIEDLHGELNFLNIWPFSLSDHEDGFWNLRIGRPFQERSEESLRLLYALMDHVMMRHSKSQRYLDGRKLINMPGRVIEWKEFHITDNNERFVVQYLESFVADALCEFLRFGGGQAGHALNYGQIRHFVAWLSLAMTNIEGVPLAKLDQFQRMLRGDVMLHFNQDTNGTIRLMPPKDALDILQRQVRSDGGLHHDTNRNLASTGYAQKEEEFRKQYEVCSTKKLRAMVVEQDLPVPTAWQALPFKVAIQKNSNMLWCYMPRKTKEEEAAEALQPQAVEDKGVSHYVKMGDELKVECDLEHDELIAELVEEYDEEDDTTKSGAITINSRWYLESINRQVAAWKKIEAHRKKPYIDLLLSKHFQSANETLHELGFSTLYKIMAGQNVDCPICLMPATRPVLTPCVHAYCRVCVEGLIHAGQPFQAAKCAVCRKRIVANQLIEIDMTPQIEEEVHDAEEEKEEEEEEEEDEEVHELPSIVRLDSRPAASSSSSSSSSRPADVVPAASSSSSSASSSSSSSSSSTAVSKDDSNTVFRNKVFSMDSLAPTREEVEARNVVNFNMPRNHMYPSLSPSFLAAHQRCTSRGFYSARFLAVLRDMQDVLKDDPFAKFVIFTQYSASLQGMKAMFDAVNEYRRSRFGGEPLQLGGVPLSNVGYECAIIDGHGSSQTDANLSRFRNSPQCNVCLLTTGVAATGLTLTMSYTCYILEPTHNAAEEAQALSRVHRIGQSNRCVRCVIFYGNHSSEERLLALRQQLGTLSSHFSVDNEIPVIGKTAKNNNKKSKKRKRRYADSDDDSSDDEDIIANNEAVNNGGSGMFNAVQLRSILGVSADRLNDYRQRAARG